MAKPGVERVDRLTPQQAQAVLALRDAVTAVEGASPLSDHVVLAISGHAPGSHLLQSTQGELTGYAYLEGSDHGPVAELVAAVGHDAAPLLDDLLDAADGRLQIWARGDKSALADLLPARGFEPVRTLLQLRRPTKLPVDAPIWPPGVRVRTFVVGEDETAWLAVNNAAFADHPDQSGWTLDDIAARERETWFDPAGFFLAERDGDVVGFHWTKVHQMREPDRQRIGEVYVIGVSPVMQGQRLGAALLAQGLRYLQGRDVPTVMLYVDATNSGAIALYERMGFARWDTDRCYRRS